MGKRTRDQMKLLSFLAVWLVALSCMGAFCKDVWAGQFSISPSFSVQEQFDDNVFLTEKDRKADYITRLIPSVVLDYKAPLWNWNLAYSLDFRHFAKNTVSDNFAQNINLQNSTELIKKLFYIDASDTYAKTSLSLPINYSQQSLFLNQTDQNIATLKPYFKLKTGQSTTVAAGYSYQNIWYKSGLGVKKSVNSVFVEAKDDVSHSFELSAGGLYLADSNGLQDYYDTDVHVGSRYVYSNGSDLFFTFGHGNYVFAENGGSGEWAWDAGADRRFAAFSARLEASSGTVENPSGLPDKVDTYSASITTSSARTPVSVGLSLNEYTDLVTKALKDRSYGITGTVSHKFTRAFRGSVNLEFQRLEDKVAMSYSNLVISGMALNWQIARRAELSLGYQYIYSHSPLISMDRYLDDQVTAGVTWAFGKEHAARPESKGGAI
ncbi:MAG: TIGR03016 family PEP-CTERM system-associated outer membrane protein [Actinomycetota bacterium]|nr:TIGR03016 family PEP-CTERM system-associated outer membrane protein [Actinomycetota bacterium]